MADIRLVAMRDAGGPHVPAEVHAMIRRRKWPGGGTVPVLSLSVGQDNVDIWPADVEHMRKLGTKLVALAERLEQDADYGTPEPA